MLGGTEKLRGEADYGVPLYDRLEQGFAGAQPDVVADLSDEAVLDARRRFGIASRCLAAGLPLRRRRSAFDPVEFEPLASFRLAAHREQQAHRQDGGRRPCRRLLSRVRVRSS